MYVLKTCLNEFLSIWKLIYNSASNITNKLKTMFNDGVTLKF